MRATGMKSPSENGSCSTCGRSEFRFGSPNSMTWPSAALLSTYSAPTTPPPPVRITEIIGWPKWGSAAVVMMLAWSTCEPPNGYGVTNCSSLSGNALAALVSAKAAAAVVASEVIDRRVVMISLFAITFLRSPRHRRRLAFGNRQVPSLEVGRVAPASLLPCCAADCLDQDGSPFPSPQLFQYRRRVMHRSDPKRAFLVQQQISELGPEDAHRVFQQRLKYRLQFTGRRSDDFENLSAREQLLQGLVPLPDESRDLFFQACRDRTATTTSVYGGAI